MRSARFYCLLAILCSYFLAVSEILICEFKISGRDAVNFVVTMVKGCDHL